jgi:hypothetical protein
MTERHFPTDAEVAGSSRRPKGITLRDASVGPAALVGSSPVPCPP